MVRALAAISNLCVQTKSKRLQTRLYVEHNFHRSLMMTDGDSSFQFFAMISCATSKGIIALILHQTPSKATWTTSSVAFSLKMWLAETKAKKC